MKRLLILAFAIAPFVAFCQGELPRLKNPKQSKVDKDVWDITSNEGFWVHYEQRKEMLEKFEKEAKLKMWNEEKRATELAKLPAGGWITAKAVGSLTGADPHNLTFIILDEKGNEIQRYQPDSRLPDVVSLAYGVYSSIAVVPVVRELQQEYKVFVVNDSKGKRYEFLIRPL